ncbi:NUDIX hydrolase [Pacificoceanicola onchidii]|uniref:NUDIX hydrolase n=1 Tax=Pacificoceanicola onchidii TaxID=2562685 RepID=UPI0010A3A5FF|nr:NUDIX hydrolase [Pacificoceanicola onchidii]
MPETAEQIAALPMRWDKDGELKILMVTSRETKRWVMPKGWEMDGKKPWRAAEIEALEEAGARGYIGKETIGTYSYLKKLGDGTALPCEVRVYPMIVEKLEKRWKERKERKRHWFTPRSAARKVHEPELSALLMSLVKKPKKDPTIKALLKKAS